MAAPVDHESPPPPPGRTREGKPDIGSSLLALSFDEQDDVAESMRAEVAQHGWELPAPGIFPMVRSCEHDGIPGPPDERDVRIMTACALSLAGMLIRSPARFADDSALPFCETYDNDDVSVRFTAPYDAAHLFEINDLRSQRESGPKIGRNAPEPRDAVGMWVLAGHHRRA